MVHDTQNNQPILISYNKRCIRCSYYLNLVLSWSGLGSIIIASFLIVVHSKEPGIYECGIIVLSVSIILLFMRCTFDYSCIKMEVADTKTDTIETTHPMGQQPSTSINIHPDQENRVILMTRLNSIFATLLNQ